jgi:hypothetical protein
MRLFKFALFLCAVVSAAADYHATELIMNVLSQFLSTPSTETTTTTEAPGILPKILNPMHWIPNFENIPWNPDSELTTVIIRLNEPINGKLLIINFSLQDGNCRSTRLRRRKLLGDN